jgi:hypothetical protein
MCIYIKLVSYPNQLSHTCQAFSRYRISFDNFILLYFKMRYSFVSALLAGASLVLSSPIQKRDEYAMDFAAPPGGDVTILNYALTLEYLERTFYQEGLANYTQAQFIEAGFPDPFYKNLKEIYYDEQVCSLLS